MADVKKDLTLVIKAKNEASQTLKQLNNDVGSMTKGFSLSNVGIMAVAGSIGALGLKMIKAAGEFEQTKVAFSTMLGSMEQANTLLRDLQNFASSTPFELKDLEKNTKLLLAYGVAANEMIPTLKMLGDVSSGLSVPIEQVALAFGQVKVAGKLTGQELRQFINAGVPLIAELSKNLGKSKAEIKSMVEEGKIGFKDVENAFKSMTGEGGKFNDMMEAQSKTLLGRISNLKDKWDIFLRTQGQGLMMLANKAVDALSGILDWLVKDAEGFNYVGKTIYGLGQFFTALGKTIMAIIKTFVGFGATMIDTAKIGFALVKDMWNNFTNLGTRLKQIFAAIGQALTGNFDEAKKTIGDLVNDTFQNTIKEFDNYKTNTDATSKFVADAWGEAGNAWKGFVKLEGFDTAVQKFGSLGGNIEEIGGDLGDTGKEAKKLAELMNKLGENISDTWTKTGDALNEVGAKIIDITKKINDLNTQYAKDDLSMRQDYASTYVEQEKKVADLKKELADKQVDYNTKMNEDVNSDNIAQHNREMAKLQEELDAMKLKYEAERTAFEQSNAIEVAYRQEVEEARRRASLTEYQRQLEDLRTKRFLMDQEYQEKYTALQKELELEVAKYNEIKAYQEQMMKNYAYYLAMNEKATADSINKEIQKWNELAKAIDRAKQGKTSAYLSTAAVNSAVQSTGANVKPITINITGNTLLDQKAAEKMGNLIINKLKTANSL